MQKRIKAQGMSPLPEEEVKDQLSFPDAIREVLNGRSITRTSWANQDYCLLKDGWLTLYINGEFRQWLVNDGDLNAIDWVVLPEAN